MKKIIIVGIAILLTNCGPTFLDRKPLGQLTTPSFYQTETDALEAVMAVYSAMQGVKFYGKEYYYITESASDDCTNKLDNEPLDNFNWSPVTGSQTVGYFSDVYLLGYEGVLRANLVLDKVPAISMDPAKKAVFLAEARFLRGLFYWHLASLYGGVALYDKVETLDSIYKIPRSTRDQVYRHVEKDLLAAIESLPDSWDGANLGRATKWSAKAFLGKVYLHWACYSKLGNSDSLFSKSKQQLTDVINSNRFTLLDSFDDVFSPTKENNAETLFEIQYAVRLNSNGYIDDIGVGGEGTQRDLLFGIQNQTHQQGYGELIATQDVMKSFEIGDPRTAKTLYFPWDSSLTGYVDGSVSLYSGTLVYLPSFGTTVKATGNILGEYFHVKKAVNGYCGAGGSINSGNNWRMIRYSDVLLMCAEAINELNGGPTAEAIDYLNRVRKRAKKMSKKDANGVPYGEQYAVRLTPTPYPTVSGVSTGPDGYLNDFPYVAVNNYGISIDLSGGSFDDFRQAIVLERRYEFAFEYLRFLDMKRWEAYTPNHPGAATTIFQQLGITSYNKNIHQLCPIPQYQIDLMKGALTQNPGY